MTDSITSIEFADERRDIDAEFAHLREIMESRSFRTNSGLAGEQPYYIYDYPAVQELEVAEHTKQLANQLRTMTPKYDGDFAPQVFTLDLYDIALEILDDRHILDRVLRNEKRRHVKMSSNVHADKFLGLLDNVMGADTDQLPNTIRKHYEEAKAEGGADIVFITGIGKVYPYIRAHTLLNMLQGRIDDRPLVLFYPGTFTRSTSSGSSMSLFGCLPGDNYYRARSLREMSVQLGA
ncbi:DUF1788 domain-containing protein [Bifidobacterium dentium]|uniref:DUF1788 domain-containing protein n=1 Tax=Bifidobacterium dentium TaxID=1689 RepID=UPI003D1658A6